jgi:hypothetical protein
MEHSLLFIHQKTEYLVQLYMETAASRIDLVIVAIYMLVVCLLTVKYES